MSQVAIRDAIVAHVDAAFKAQYPTYKLAYDNSPFDWGAPPTEFVQLEIDFLDAEQIGMAWEPKTRIYGYVYVTAYNRTGSGSRVLLSIMDFFTDLLKYRSIGLVQMKAAQPGGGKPVKNYYTEQVKFAFYSVPL